MLARNGYTWTRFADDEEGADAASGWSNDVESLTAWRLVDENGATVTVAEALAAIAAKG
jgi:hypothetical protein